MTRFSFGSRLRHWLIRADWRDGCFRSVLHPLPRHHCLAVEPRARLGSPSPFGALLMGLVLAGLQFGWLAKSSELTCRA